MIMRHKHSHSKSYTMPVYHVDKEAIQASAQEEYEGDNRIDHTGTKSLEMDHQQAAQNDTNTSK